jgi:hypothetical protein
MRKKTTTTTKSPMKVLHESKLVDKDRGRYTRIFEFNEKKFKLIYDLRNGVSDVFVQIMDSSGEFKFVLNKYDLGFEFGVSYVGYPADKEKDILKAIKLVDEVIPKIYS